MLMGSVGQMGDDVLDTLSLGGVDGAMPVHRDQVGNSISCSLNHNCLYNRII